MFRLGVRSNFVRESDMGRALMVWRGYLLSEFFANSVVAHAVVFELLLAGQRRSCWNIGASNAEQ